MAKFNLRGTGTDTTYLAYKGTTLSFEDLDSNFRGLGDGANALYVAAVTAIGDVTAFSDERLKENITTIPNALEKVMSLRGVSFDKDGNRNIGVIAQEVEQVVPEVVKTEDDEMGTKSVAYGNLVGLLIQAIKEQQAEIDSLKNLISSKDV